MKCNLNNLKNQAIPKIQILDEEQIARIHRNSLKILSDTGVRIDSVSARKIFSKATGREEKENKVSIPGELVDWAIEKAPPNIRIYNRKGQKAFDIGVDHTRDTIFGIGVTNTHYQDNVTEDIVPFTREHMRISCRLGEILPEFDLVSTIGIPTDVAAAHADLYSIIDMYANTVKPLVLLILEKNNSSRVFDLLHSLHGDLAVKSPLLTYVNPVTPLIINESTIEKIELSISYGCPVIYSNYSMSGATTPIDAAGTLALLNAELLAGLVLCQLIKEGSEVILGSLPAGFDMSSMSSPYTPQTFLLNLACAELMEHYQIPHCGTSGSGSGWGPDLPASDMLWINHLTSCLGKVGMAPFVGGNFESLVFSPATVIYADQIISQIREFARGFDPENISASLKDIGLAGPGGDFLTSDKTLETIRTAGVNKNIWSGMSLARWQKEGHPKASERLKEYVTEIMNNLRAPEDYEELMGKGEEMIENMLEK